MTAAGPGPTAADADSPGRRQGAASAPLRWLLVTGVAAVVLGGLTIVAWWPRDGGTSAAAAVPDGSQLFRVKGCIGCHDGPDGRAAVQIGPALTGLRQRAGERVPGEDAETYVRRSVLEPQAFVVPGFEGDFSRMPVLPVTDVELDAIVTYLLAPAP